MVSQHQAQKALTAGGVRDWRASTDVDAVDAWSDVDVVVYDVADDAEIRAMGMTDPDNEDPVDRLVLVDSGMDAVQLPSRNVDDTIQRRLSCQSDRPLSMVLYTLRRKNIERETQVLVLA